MLQPWRKFQRKSKTFLLFVKTSKKSSFWHFQVKVLFIIATYVLNLCAIYLADGVWMGRYLKVTFTSAVLAEKYGGKKTWTCNLQEFFSYLCQTCEIKHQWIYNITQLQMWENKSNCKRERPICAIRAFRHEKWSICCYHSVWLNIIPSLASFPKLGTAPLSCSTWNRSSQAGNTKVAFHD